ncbi:MAG: DUF4148 domain-containing protein [Rhodospirillales bacterium]|nr:DUF4148 domain-containing protein [Alphaproteobacteria bacterium]MCB1840331.1 DUF4148 domain-containing protein [Alphaproteobacteria bacterium]MCB9976984.1 DUF4148 domain-containing protein [Rhodospirillales bacterium]
MPRPILNKKLLVLTAAVIGLSAPALAQPAPSPVAPATAAAQDPSSDPNYQYTAAWLADICRPAVKTWEKTKSGGSVDPDEVKNFEDCMMYLSGFRDGYDYLHKPVEGQATFCIPGEVVTGKLAQAFLSHIDLYPSAGKRNIVDGIGDAFGEAYPCPKQ